MIRWLRLPDEPNSQRPHPQQPLLDRAQEDLICAIFLHKNIHGYYPAANICYLLHQSIEKLIKVLLAITRKGYDRTHDLHELFNALSKCHTITNQPKMTKQVIRDTIKRVNSIKKEIKRTDPRILNYNFQSDLRYNEVDSRIDEYIRLLMKSALKMRRILEKFIQSYS